MQVNRTQSSNNQTFGAYFKNNTNFKNVLSNISSVPEERLVDKFRYSCPSHELEIIDIQPIRFEKSYTIFNNTLGKGVTIQADPQLALETILKKLTNLRCPEYKQLFKEDSFKRIYKKLI